MINEIKYLTRHTIEWIKDDWHSHRIRFVVELFAWAISIGCSITMALTVPTPPLLILYPIWLLVALCMLGLLILGNHLGCLLTTYC